MSGQQRCAGCQQDIEFSEHLFDDGHTMLHFVGRWMVGESCPSREAVEHFENLESTS